MMYRYKPVIETTVDGRWRWALWGQRFDLVEETSLELIADGRSEDCGIAVVQCGHAILLHQRHLS